jgi:actin-related protein 8
VNTAEDGSSNGARDQQNLSKEDTITAAEFPSNNQADMVDIDDDSKPLTAHQLVPRPSQAQTPVTPPPSGFSIDVPFEASKLPLDVAIFNSARATGGDEKIRKNLQAVLVVGGTALTQGIVHALESRCSSALYA